MPALNFKYQFIEPIRTGAKTHTIRGRLPPGFNIGSWMPLYYGQRTRQCMLIGSGLADRTYDIRFDFDENIAEAEGPGGTSIWDDWADLNRFAVSDGFEDWNALAAFWEKNHPGVRQFSGVLIGWKDFTLEYRLGFTADTASDYHE
jgi:hypothetical protein